MGVANYFSIDVSLVRILFLISIFFGGFGVLIYFILWFITPEATTVGEKMSMKGYSVTLENIEKYDYVMTHDGVRPYIDLDSLEKIYASILESDYDCIFYGIKPKDSIKRLEGGSLKVEERDNFILVQTPQICESKKLKNALEVLTSKNIYPTDESSAMENSGYSVNFIEGSQKNIKITFQEDLVKEDILIGNGFDLHRFCEGNSIVFGGVKFPFEFGIEAISDGDVILHSLADSILGALSEGDIGTSFPEDDPNSKDLDSREIITHCLDLMKKRGYHPVSYTHLRAHET